MFLPRVHLVPHSAKSAPTGHDPVEALTETAETATEAASSLLAWLRSGSREALIALGITVLSIAGLYALRWALAKGMERLPQADDVSIAAMAERIVKRFRGYFIIAIAFYITNTIVPLPEAASGFINVLLVITGVLQLAEWVQEASTSFVRRNVRRSSSDASTLASAVNIIKWFVTVAIWSIAALLILDNVGADVSALIAGLGIGGIAVGLAAQGMFRDLFSSLSIIFDKPFQVGDTVRYGDTWGTVEDIGLKTTRIRAKHGEQIIISNTMLLDQEIHNMKRMARRRIETGFGVIYQTSPDLAERIPGIVAETVKSIQGAEFDRCGMSAYGASSIDYELVFYALNPDFNRSMAIRSHVLLALFRKFKEEGIVFAYPTQTLYIEGAGEEAIEATVQSLKTAAND
ncbi:MAG: mechanosensitive ion channel family protein [Hyphomonadaceae bacterium]|nr:mechanosensitive ion channel family protein [Hyphomonadaceae bacterium]